MELKVMWVLELIFKYVFSIYIFINHWLYISNYYVIINCKWLYDSYESWYCKTQTSFEIGLYQVYGILSQFLLELTQVSLISVCSSPSNNIFLLVLLGHLISHKKSDIGPFICVIFGGKEIVVASGGVCYVNVWDR